MRAANRFQELAHSATTTKSEAMHTSLSRPMQNEWAGAPPEPFVDANRAAEFLSIRPRRVLELARQGAIPAHPLGDRQRKIWRFRLSELAAAMCSRAVNYSRQSPAPKEIENGAW